jgi:hypothetical protein
MTVLLTLAVPSLAVIVAQPSPLPAILNVALVSAFTESGTVTIDVLLLDNFQ